MAGEHDEDTAALLAMHRRQGMDTAMLRAAFVRDALASGRHSRASLADLLEETGRLFPGYAGSSTEMLVAALRREEAAPEDEAAALGSGGGSAAGQWTA